MVMTATVMTATNPADEKENGTPNHIEQTNSRVQHIQE